MYHGVPCAVFLLLAVPAGGQGIAPPPPPAAAHHPGRRALAERMVEATVLDPMARIPQLDRQALETEGHEVLMPALSGAEQTRLDLLWRAAVAAMRPQARERFASIYAQAFTEEELRGIVPFFESAAGQAYARAGAATAGQELGSAPDVTRFALGRRMAEMIDEPAFRSMLARVQMRGGEARLPETDRAAMRDMEARETRSQAMARGAHYARTLSAEQMREIITFFERPVGRAYLRGSMRIAGELMQATAGLDLLDRMRATYEQFCRETGKLCGPDRDQPAD